MSITYIKFNKKIRFMDRENRRRIQGLDDLPFFNQERPSPAQLIFPKSKTSSVSKLKEKHENSQGEETTTSLVGPIEVPQNRIPIEFNPSISLPDVPSEEVLNLELPPASSVLEVGSLITPGYESLLFKYKNLSTEGSGIQNRIFQLNSLITEDSFFNSDSTSQVLKNAKAVLDLNMFFSEEEELLFKKLYNDLKNLYQQQTGSGLSQDSLEVKALTEKADALQQGVLNHRNLKNVLAISLFAAVGFGLLKTMPLGKVISLLNMWPGSSGISNPGSLGQQPVIFNNTVNLTDSNISLKKENESSQEDHRFMGVLFYSLTRFFKKKNNDGDD